MDYFKHILRVVLSIVAILHNSKASKYQTLCIIKGSVPMCMQFIPSMLFQKLFPDYMVHYRSIEAYYRNLIFVVLCGIIDEHAVNMHMNYYNLIFFSWLWHCCQHFKRFVTMVLYYVNFKTLYHHNLQPCHVTQTKQQGMIIQTIRFQ